MDRSCLVAPQIALERGQIEIELALITSWMVHVFSSVRPQDIRYAFVCKDMNTVILGKIIAD